VHNLKEFVEENCLICGSHNYIRIREDMDAWTCWNCNSNWWIDDEAKTIFMILNEFEEDLVDKLLIQSSSLINFANGQAERDG